MTYSLELTEEEQPRIRLNPDLLRGFTDAVESARPALAMQYLMRIIEKQHQALIELTGNIEDENQQIVTRKISKSPRVAKENVQSEE